MYNADNEILDAAFENYFSGNRKTNDIDRSISIIQEEPLPDTKELIRLKAQGNIPDIDSFGELLRKLLNAAWGSEWGYISPEFSQGDDPDNVDLPAISYDTISREVAEGIGKVKPTLTESVKEVIDGKATGDVIQIYSQWFDCIVEFDCWGKTSLEARELLQRFEYVLSFYSGFLKEQGVSEILFLKEIPAKQSIHYIDSYHMKAVMYHVRLERKYMVRQSTLKEVEVIFHQQEGKTTGEIPDDIYSNKNNNITYDF